MCVDKILHTIPEAFCCRSIDYKGLPLTLGKISNIDRLTCSFICCMLTKKLQNSSSGAKKPKKSNEQIVILFGRSYGISENISCILAMWDFKYMSKFSPICMKFLAGSLSEAENNNDWIFTALVQYTNRLTYRHMLLNYNTLLDHCNK